MTIPTRCSIRVDETACRSRRPNRASLSPARLWDYEAQGDQDAGRKVRSFVIALAVERQHDGETRVTVLPVTHRPPADPAAAMVFPAAVKRHLGLDEARYWVSVSESDQ